MPGWRKTWALGLAALVARLLVVRWAAPRFPAAADGFYYDTLAHRLAAGQGYTWLWPDGAVTYAAHYPVGYPLMLAGAYRLFGAYPAAGMAVSAILGAAATIAMHRLALRPTPTWRADAAALVVAAHPALVPYTAAFMTEAIAAYLLVIAASLGAVARDRPRRWPWLAGAGLVLGVATLVRPQCLLFAPVLGLLATPPGSAVGRAWAAALVTAVTLAVCAPWTVRNCVRMERCALVSVNGGWNLLIGEQTTTGGWGEVSVPPPCREVWAEAAKDVCFERAARAAILEHPGSWLAKMPGKLAATFDYIGASPWYMHTSNGAAFGDDDKRLDGALETLVTRLLLVGALVACARMHGPRVRARAVIAALGGLSAVTLHAWIGYVAIVAALLALGVRALARAPVLVTWTCAFVLGTAATHAVFFGAGRYGLVVLPFVGALAFVDGGRASPVPPEPIASERSSRS